MMYMMYIWYNVNIYYLWHDVCHPWHIRKPNRKPPGFHGPSFQAVDQNAAQEFSTSTCPAVGSGISRAAESRGMSIGPISEVAVVTWSIFDLPSSGNQTWQWAIFHWWLIYRNSFIRKGPFFAKHLLLWNLCKLQLYLSRDRCGATLLLIKSQSLPARFS
jgi:hypothetical protein